MSRARAGTLQSGLQHEHHECSRTSGRSAPPGRDGDSCSCPATGFPGGMAPRCCASSEHPPRGCCSGMEAASAGRSVPAPLPHCACILPAFGVAHPTEHPSERPGCCRLDPGTGLSPRGWVGCRRVLPVPAPSAGCAAFCISSSHCHSNRRSAWVPAVPAPASRSAILAHRGGGRCRHGTARLARLGTAFGEVWAMGASGTAPCPAGAEQDAGSPRGLVSRQKIPAVGTSSL